MIESDDNKRRDEYLDRLRVRLGLAATHPAQSADAITTDELIGLREGSLSPQERTRVLAVLDSSESCYAEWLALNRFLDDEERKRLRAGRPSRVSLRHWGAGVAAAALILGAIVIVNRPASLDSMLDQSYAEAQSSGVVAASLPLWVLSPDPTPDLGLAGKLDAPQARALRAGLWAGAAHLRDFGDLAYPEALLPPGQEAARLADKPWQDTRWAAHASLGQWLVLVTAACEEPAREQQVFWRQQTVIAARLETEIAAGDTPVQADPLRSQLRELAAPLEDLAADGPAERACNDFVRGAERVVALAGRSGT